jgi:hypothetical protein
MTVLNRFHLTPKQALICGCVFIVTSIGAVVLAIVFQRMNGTRNANAPRQTLCAERN